MIIAAQGASKDFIRQGRGTNVLPAVKPTDLTVEPGKLTVLMGRSGSGKTTLLNMLAGLLIPTKGRITYDGEDIYAFGDEKLSRFRNANIGVIPQGQTCVRSLDIIGNICLSYLIYGTDEEREKSYPAAKRLMERLGISELGQASPDELSGGELRRMAIARAMLRKPQVIFADEPTCDLDDENTGLVLNILKETAQSGAAVFIVTHEREAENYADVLLNMTGGTVEAVR